MRHTGIVFWIIAIMPMAVSADGLSLDVNGYSRHSRSTYEYQGERHEYNAVNAGLGLTKRLNDNVDVAAGFYENSYYKTSVYGGAHIHLNFVRGNFALRPGVSVGLVTGYADTPDNTGLVRLMALPTLSVSAYDFGVRVGFVPSVPDSRGTTVSVLTVQFQYLIN